MKIEIEIQEWKSRMGIEIQEWKSELKLEIEIENEKWERKL